VSAQTLEDAIIALCKATDAQGLKVFLCNPMDMDDVRKNLRLLCCALSPNEAFLHPLGQEAAARNVALLANLFHEHLKYKRELRESTDACSPQT
jgi:predicted transcriptional regulator